MRTKPSKPHKEKIKTMFEFIKRINYKRRHLKTLKEQAYQKEMMEAYSRHTIPQLRELIDATEKEIKQKLQEIDKTRDNLQYGARVERNKLEQEIKDHKTRAKTYSEQIGTVEREAANIRAQIAEIEYRRLFIKKHFGIFKTK